MRVWGVLLVMMSWACNEEAGPPPVAAAPPPVTATPQTAAPATAPPIVDAAMPDALIITAADAAPDAAPDGGVGFRIVAGAAIVEVEPAAPKPKARRGRRKIAKAPPGAPPRRAASAMHTIRAHTGDVSACYSRVALKDPSVAGRITVQWTIGRDGAPTAVAITQDTLKDKSVGACIKARAKRWRFPPPAGGVQVISYPFDLRVQ